MAFPASLTEEELELKNVFEMLKRIKKLSQAAKLSMGNAKGEADAGKLPRKRNLTEIAGATEEAKRLVKAGAMTISKVEEKQTFKRSKQLDRRLKETDKDTGVKYQPFTASNYRDDSTDDMFRSERHYRGLDSGYQDGPGGYGAQRGTTIYIRGYDLMEDPLRKAFCEFGKIVRIHVEERRKSAFIEFSTNEEADKAIKEMNGNMLGGITLRVTMARRQNYVFGRPRPDHRPWQATPDSWTNTGYGGGPSKESGREEGRGLVTYDDTDD